ncbi:hypothetical protein APA_352 [Pseudanabaena sp. lw0831]|uniref:hypothetical protein n=1 Tax=Pseudanabaena sp. lw0831 TaxID=1357935 RepID=UPI0019153952|nr:hypothetical protein [Pseudanabaena sp. lw0831]GBO52683.1 hypothetical protein APA_352 [Pseudanabaena sp. lw0831]
MNSTSKIYKATIDKAWLDSLPNEDRIFFLTLAHILNEINGFYKLLYWTSDISSKSDLIVLGQLTFSRIAVITLVGKLKEANAFLNHYIKENESFEKYKKKMSQEGIDAISNIHNYFDKRNKNFMDVVRNLAFHYPNPKNEHNQRTVDDGFSSVLPEELTLYLGKDGSSNDLYYFAEAAFAHSLYKLVDDSDVISSMRKLEKESMKVGRWFRQFGHAFIVAFLNEHGKPVWKELAEEVELPPLESFSDIQIPWFTDTQELVDLE